MKIGIIGAGFTGLAAGLSLVKEGQEVTIFEKEEKPGGLTIGFREVGWQWLLEKHYHHIFISDSSIRDLAGKVGERIIFKRPKTSVLVGENIYQLDSPLNLLFFPKLPFIDRLRVGIVLFYLKLTPFWEPLEKVTANDFLKKTMGDNAWRILWEPLFEKKFGEYKNKIPASWFWARIKKRSTSLGYPEGGFETFAKMVEKRIKKKKGMFFYGVEIKGIRKEGRRLKVAAEGRTHYFDRVICTLPSKIFLRMTEDISGSYRKKILSSSGLGAVNLVLVLRKRFLEDGTYWLNINEKKFPFCSVVEQTNFISPRFYSGDRIIYVGNYLRSDHRYFQMDSNDLLDEFYPYLKKINPNFDKSWIKKVLVFKTPFAQPLVTLNHSKKIPPLATPIPGLYLANIEQVYPWDRGTNYAVELGEKVAKLCV